MMNSNNKTLLLVLLLLSILVTVKKNISRIRLSIELSHGILTKIYVLVSSIFSVGQ